MAYLDTYTASLTAKTATHLLRRATFGPTQQEIVAFTGKTAAQAVNILFENSSYRAIPDPPIELDELRSDVGQTFVNKPFNTDRIFIYNGYIQNWWIGLMTEQNGFPSVLEKLTAFWQNHFVIQCSNVADYRLVDKYIRFLRGNALGNFRTLVTEITKDGAMLIFQNGNENEKKFPNENYARELQELFTVGQKNYLDESNYTEQDVKAAARTLTGWQVTNYKLNGSSSFNVVFNPDRHDTADKAFSSKYDNTVIAGRSGATAGDEEISDLVSMLLRHPETPKFICRKLYRWYVNPNVTQEIENEVIAPLAAFFASSANNFAISPVLKKLLTSEIFFNNGNFGAIVKSPAEFMIGTIRFYDQPVPDIRSEYGAFRILTSFIGNSMSAMDLNLLNQPSVFGSLPFYQTGYSKNWISGTTLGLRGARTDTIVYPSLVVKPGYVLGIDVLKQLTSLQQNFSDVAGTPAISAEQVFESLTKNLFTVDLSQAQVDFLIDKILMMNSSPRTSWTNEWNAYRLSPSDIAKQNVILWRCRALLKHMLRMAEYQLY